MFVLIDKFKVIEICEEIQRLQYGLDVSVDGLVELLEVNVSNCEPFKLREVLSQFFNGERICYWADHQKSNSFNESLLA
jgi:hypothetical protein